MGLYSNYEPRDLGLGLRPAARFSTAAPVPNTSLCGRSPRRQSWRTNRGGRKEFAALLNGCRSVDELTSGKFTTLRGRLYRAGDNMSAVATADGQLVELETSAVDCFKVIGAGVIPTWSCPCRRRACDRRRRRCSNPWRPTARSRFTRPITTRSSRIFERTRSSTRSTRGSRTRSVAP